MAKELVLEITLLEIQDGKSVEDTKVRLDNITYDNNMGCQIYNEYVQDSE